MKFYENLFSISRAFSYVETYRRTDGQAVQQAFLGVAEGSNNYVNLKGRTVITSTKKNYKVLYT
jgi:hypothetical protein